MYFFEKKKKKRYDHIKIMYINMKIILTRNEIGCEFFKERKLNLNIFS